MQPPIPVAALRWLELSGRAERGLIVLGALIVLAIVVASIRGRRRPVPAIPPIPQRQELVLLLGIVVLAALLRTLFATSEHQPRLFFPESGVMDAATLLAKGGLWDRWKTVLSSTQVNWPQESAVMVPVNALAVATLGPSLELPQYIGSLCGILAVVLAWLVGRAVVSPAFGLAFAGLVAVSPLQITWARLGGLHIAAVPHTLLVLWLAHRAGSRRSVALALLAGVVAWTSVYDYYAARVAIPLSLLALAAGMRAAGCERSIALALLAGVVAWTSVYHYYAARVAIPLSLLALLAGMRAAGSARRQWVVLPLCLGSGFVAAGVLAVGMPTLASLWPRYPGYVGNRSEVIYGTLLGSIHDNLRQQLAPTLRTYFWNGRAEDLNALWERPATGPGTALDPGFAHGGLCLLPVVLLGLIGLARLRALRAWYLWIALALGGLALPVLSAATARRFLIFDLAWCALAAHGGVVLARMRPLVEASPGARRTVFAGAVLALAAWSGGGLDLLYAALPPAHGTKIPLRRERLRRRHHVPRMRARRPALGARDRGRKLGRARGQRRAARESDRAGGASPVRQAGGARRRQAGAVHRSVLGAPQRRPRDLAPERAQAVCLRRQVAAHLSRRADPDRRSRDRRVGVQGSDALGAGARQSAPGSGRNARQPGRAAARGRGGTAPGGRRSSPPGSGRRARGGPRHGTPSSSS